MAFRKAKITIKAVEALKSDEIIADTALPGFMVRRQKGEARVYFIRKAHGGRRHYQTIGEHGLGWTEATARTEAQLLLGSIQKGQNPTAARLKAKGTPTLKAWIETFLAQREGVVKPGTLYNYRGFLKNYIAPMHPDGRVKAGAIGQAKIDEVTRVEIANLHRSLIEPYPGNAECRL